MSAFLRSSVMAIAMVAGLGILAIPIPGFAQGKATRIEELMTRYYDYDMFNGTVLVAEKGKVIYKKGFGLANMEWEISNTTDTKFRLGSITKQFTAMLIMQLVEGGKLKLEDTVSAYLPYYREDIGKKVTVHHLLAHTSGIPSYTGLPRFFEDVSRDSYEVDAFIKKYCSGDLEFEPGSKYRYNNSGYFLLGAIIEQVTGKPYEIVLKEQILDAVGMADTGYDHHNTLISRRAAGYGKTIDGYENAPYLDMSLPYSAGSMYSTVEDLYLWDQVLYTDQLLSRKHKEHMFRPNLNNYAYGWSVRKISLGRGRDSVRVVSHGGGINGFNTRITRLVDDMHLIVLLNNTGGTRLDEMTRRIIRILYDQSYDLPKEPVSRVLTRTLREKGVESAVQQYRELKKGQPDAYNFAERELDRLGYSLLRAERAKDAVEILKLNVAAFPKSSNVYGRLGEAYMESGEIDSAVVNYAKALELNPKNRQALRMLKKLYEDED